MLRKRQPDSGELKKILSAQAVRSFSYAPVGMTQGSIPPGYTLDHNRVRLGAGGELFEKAKVAITRWRMFDIGWASLFPQDAVLASGVNVAVVARLPGFWSVNVCRVAYLVNEDVTQATDGVTTVSTIKRFGFAYGTLPEHAERGEERFCVEWNTRDDSVWYDILAFSKPGPIARLAYPYTRRLQKRFARDSMNAMLRTVSGQQS